MKPMTRPAMAIALATLGGTAHAHVADLPLLQHALEHGWLALVLLPLLLLLLPLRGERR